MRAMLGSALNPASVAVVARRQSAQSRRAPILYLQRYGYRGRDLSINPTRSTVQDCAHIPRSRNTAGARSRHRRGRGAEAVQKQSRALRRAA